MGMKAAGAAAGLVLALNFAIIGGIGFGLYKGGEFIYDNTEYGMQNNALSAVFNNKMEGERAIKYLSSHGFSTSQAGKLADCNGQEAYVSDLSPRETRTNVRNCMLR